jgi:hypothetical protein
LYQVRRGDKNDLAWMKRERDEHPRRHYYDTNTDVVDKDGVSSYDDDNDDDDHLDQDDGDCAHDDGDMYGAHNSDSDIDDADATRKVGRPVARYLLREQHPLHDTYVVVRRAKTAVPALAGNPPPKLPGKDASQSQNNCFAVYYCTLFLPWHCRQGIVLPTMQNFDDYWKQLEDDACLHRARESDDSETDDDEDEEPRRLRRTHRAAMARRRAIAAGRRATMKQHIDGIHTKSAVNTLVQRHRARMRTIWSDKNRPPNAYDDDDDNNDKRRRREKALRKLLEEIEKLRGVDCVATSATRKH